MSFHDDYISENAKFRSKAGLDCYITRTGSHCCEWCTAVSGKYAFGEQPADIFRRHDNCDCVIVYDTEVLRGKKSNGRYTRAWDKPEVKKPSKPEIITDPQELESRKLSEIIGLTSSDGSGKIVGELESLIRFNDNREVLQDIKSSLEKTISVIPEHLRTRLEKFVPEIIIEEGRGYSSFTKANNIILDMKYANESIIHELGHAWAKMDKLYEDEEFLNVLADRLNVEDWGNVISYNHPYKNISVYILPSEKFVIPYQGRIYADIFSVDLSEPIDLHYFQEYISVGFDTYFLNPELLKNKDFKLYKYLEEKMNE